MALKWFVLYHLNPMWYDEFKMLPDFIYLSENNPSENLVYEITSTLVSNLNDTLCAS